jgi:hypothetical protein
LSSAPGSAQIDYGVGMVETCAPPFPGSKHLAGSCILFAAGSHPNMAPGKKSTYGHDQTSHTNLLCESHQQLRMRKKNEETFNFLQKSLKKDTHVSALPITGKTDKSIIIKRPDEDLKNPVGSC